MVAATETDDGRKAGGSDAWSVESPFIREDPRESVGAVGAARVVRLLTIPLASKLSRLYSSSLPILRKYPNMVGYDRKRNFKSNEIMKEGSQKRRHSGK